MASISGSGCAAPEGWNHRDCIPRLLLFCFYYTPALAQRHGFVNIVYGASEKLSTIIYRTAIFNLPPHTSAPSLCPGAHYYCDGCVMNRSVGAQRRQHQERARQCRCLTLTPRELSLLKQLVKWGRLTCLWQRWGWLVPAQMSRSQFNFTPASASFITDDEDEF